MTELHTNRVHVLGALQRILVSEHFRQSQRLGKFLSYVVQETLAGRTDRIKAYSIGLEVFGKPPSFDSSVDPIVRTTATRLRAALGKYYQDKNCEDPLEIVLNKGSYVPEFRPRISHERHEKAILPATGPALDGQEFGTALETHSSWPWEADANLRYISVPWQIVELLGLPRKQPVGWSLLDRMHIEDSVRVAEVFSAASAHAKPFFGVVARYSRFDNTIAIVEISGIAVFDEFGAFSLYRGVHRDITPTGLLALESRPAYLDTVYATAPVALCVINRDGRLLAVNERHSILADRPISHLIGVKVAELHEEGGQNIIRDFRVLDAGGAVPEHELYIRGKTYLVSVAPIRDALGKVIAISVAHTDVTERRRLDEELAKANKLLEELAVRDHLTSLFNRRHFDKTLVDEIGRLHQEGSMLSVLLIDVDFFKRYNDQYGHIMGDQCLADIAYAIKAALHRSGDTAFRYGGEEFAIVLSNTDANGARAVAERIRIAIAALNRRHGASPLGVVTVSIGIGTVIGPYNSDMPLTRELLLRAVDTALYAAKANGRNTVIAGTVLQKNVGDG